MHQLRYECSRGKLENKLPSHRERTNANDCPYALVENPGRVTFAPSIAEPNLLQN